MPSTALKLNEVETELKYTGTYLYVPVGTRVPVRVPGYCFFVHSRESQREALYLYSCTDVVVLRPRLLSSGLKRRALQGALLYSCTEREHGH